MTRAMDGKEGMGALPAPTSWGGRKSLRMGTLVSPGLCPGAHPVQVTPGARCSVWQPVLGRHRRDAPGNQLQRHVTCVSG